MNPFAANLMGTLVERFEQAAPSAALTLRAQRDRHRGEPDLAVAIDLVGDCRTAVDIGANRGVYAHWFVKRAQRCVAFEPNPECAALLRRAIGDAADVHQVALSDHSGEATLKIPIIAGRENSYRSSIQANPEAHRAIAVTVATLDSYTLPEVDFIKIDVEGHEEETLAGAAETLVRHQPTVLVEAEERHRAGSVDAVRRRFAELGYVGFFLFDDVVRTIEDFDPSIHQLEPDSLGARSATYVNNFIFVPPHRHRHLELLELRR